MVWVKASDRVMIKRHEGVNILESGAINLKIDGEPAVGFFSTYSGIIVCSYEIRSGLKSSRSGLIPESDFNRIEWLYQPTTTPSINNNISQSGEQY